MLHVIPEDGRPHAPTAECGCGPQAEMVPGPDGATRLALVHPAADEDDTDQPGMGDTRDPTWENR